MMLRDVELSDVDAYIRMRCDPVMMADLGGPLPRDGIADKVRRDVAEAKAGTAWLKMIVLDEAKPDEVAGSLALWRHSDHGEKIAEVGWMVLPEFQGRGIGKRAVAMLLDQARGHGRWASVHAFPGVTNAASNGICRSLGFRLLGTEDYEFVGRPMYVNHWVIDPGKDLTIHPTG